MENTNSGELISDQEFQRLCDLFTGIIIRYDEKPAKDVLMAKVSQSIGVDSITDHPDSGLLKKIENLEEPDAFKVLSKVDTWLNRDNPGDVNVRLSKYRF